MSNGKFFTVTFCRACGNQVEDVLKHGPEVCPESHQNKKKRAREFAAWEAEHNRITAAWEAWEKEAGKLKNAYPSVEHTPDEIAHEGRCIVFDEPDMSDRGHVFVSPVLENPTWGDIVRQFDRSIPMVDDFHHTFLEGLHLVDISKWPEELGSPDADITILQFSTGS